MPRTSYCKKCARDVQLGERCPHCGGKLAANAVRLTWCVDHTPVKDWMCWNAVARLVMPVVGAVLLLTLLLEGVFGGVYGMLTLLGGGMFYGTLGLMLLLAAVLLLVFILQGDDLQDCVIDSRGVHVQTYVQEPTPLKLILRLRSPKLLEGMGEEPFLLVRQTEIAWKDVSRVQLWPEKCMILFYAPGWWMRLALPCTPFTWEESLDFIREKIGRKKDVVLPAQCRQSPPPKSANRTPRRVQQLSIDDLPPQPIPPEEVPPEWSDDEQPEDFTSLADVLEEIREKEETR